MFWEGYGHVLKLASLVTWVVHQLYLQHASAVMRLMCFNLREDSSLQYEDPGLKYFNFEQANRYERFTMTKDVI